MSEGEPVENAQLLAELDVQEIKAKLDQASAMKEQADRELTRFSNLLRQNAATRRSMRGVQAKARVAQAALAEAQDNAGLCAGYSALLKGSSPRSLPTWATWRRRANTLLRMEDSSRCASKRILPRALLGSVTAGGVSLFTFYLTMNSPATLAEMSPIADPNSRTFPVKVRSAAGSNVRSDSSGMPPFRCSAA